MSNTTHDSERISEELRREIEFERQCLEIEAMDDEEYRLLAMQESKRELDAAVRNVLRLFGLA